MKATNNPGGARSPARYGFATFFKDDGMYYFQFNGHDGAPIIFGHGYQSEKSRDNGIQVVIRNAADDAHYERQQTQKGQHFFTLKSGNNQEVGRSATFDTEPEMEEKLKLLKSITGDVPIFDAAGQPEGKAAAELQSVENTALDASNKELSIETLPRYKFSIIYYPDSDVWIIKHDPSGNTKQFKTCDGALIEAFMKAHLPAEKARVLPARESSPAQPKAPAQEVTPQKTDKLTEEKIEMKIRSFQGKEVRYFAKAGDLGQIEISPKQGSMISNKSYEARVIAKSLEDNETVVVSEIKARKPAYGRFVIPIFEANRLHPGMYRFLVTIHQGEKGQEEHDYHGSRMLMLN